MPTRTAAVRNVRPDTAASRPPGHVVELFAGIGGFRLGLEQRLAGRDAADGWRWERPADPDWQVVWANQWEPATKTQHAFDTYTRRFDTGVHVNADIAEVLDRAGVGAYTGASGGVDHLALAHHQLPERIDLLVGGFPCQDFSVANPLHVAGGLAGGKGALWWQIARMLQTWRPKQVLLENVDRLLTSPAACRGRDFAVLLSCFDQLGYRVEWRTVNAADYGMPQRRRRVFIYAEHDPQRTSPKLAQVRSGVLATAFPARFDHTGDGRLPDGGWQATVDSWQPPSRRPFADAGMMAAGTYVAARARNEPHDPVTLGQLQVDVPGDSPLWLDDAQLERWQYLKGAKDEPRVKVVAGQPVSWRYSEGALAFPDPLDRPARTVLTSEGGASPSRTRHVVAQDGRLRRLHPVELERATMFPDGWTDGLTPARRAFCLGNALVVGQIARLAPLLAARRRELTGCPAAA